jgi:DNA-binding Xre family transcriptional regulator
MIEFNLKEILKNRRIGQKEFAGEIEVHENTIYNICNGKSKSVNLRIINNICDKLSIPVSKLLVKK